MKPEPGQDQTPGRAEPEAPPGFRGGSRGAVPPGAWPWADARGARRGVRSRTDSSRCSVAGYHNPETEEEATEARRLGGLRRRREKTLAGAYDIGPLDNVGAIRRLLEIATFDVIGLENSIARARVLISAVLAAAKLLETGELQARVELLEAALKSRPDPDSGGGGLLGDA